MQLDFFVDSTGPEAELEVIAITRIPSIFVYFSSQMLRLFHPFDREGSISVSVPLAKTLESTDQGLAVSGRTPLAKTAIDLRQAQNMCRLRSDISDDLTGAWLTTTTVGRPFEKRGRFLFALAAIEQLPDWQAHILSHELIGQDAKRFREETYGKSTTGYIAPRRRPEIGIYSVRTLPVEVRGYPGYFPAVLLVDSWISTLEADCRLVYFAPSELHFDSVELGRSLSWDLIGVHLERAAKVGDFTTL